MTLTTQGYYESIRDKALAELEALDATKAGGLPNSQASGIDHGEYETRLRARIAWAQERLVELGRVQAATEGPFEIVTEGIP